MSRFLREIFLNRIKNDHQFQNLILKKTAHIIGRTNYGTIDLELAVKDLYSYSFYKGWNFNSGKTVIETSYK